jgi:ribosomal protein L33
MSKVNWEINLDGYKENLEECGYVSMVNDNTPIFALQELLEYEGYCTNYNSSSDRLELIKRTWRIEKYCPYCKKREIFDDRYDSVESFLNAEETEEYCSCGATIEYNEIA